MALIIVESPTKARTFNRILKGKNYHVFATMGHIRDLPKKQIAIDYGRKFKPLYEVIPTRKKQVASLKELAKNNKDVILATDPDREGESISYHVAYLLHFAKEKWPTIDLNANHSLKRIVFHEITPKALEQALVHPEHLRLNLVRAQQARRILDRIVGYELSPLLWKKIGKNWLSAGRVQTIALRLIVEREKEIKSFKGEDYSQIFSYFSKEGEVVRARLISKNSEPYDRKFTLTLFDGTYQYSKTTIDSTLSQSISEDLKKDTYVVYDIKESKVIKYPPPPLTTSMMQQEAFRRFGFTSKMTMKVAQDLYERGLITYHRTDSFNLSTQFVFAAKAYIGEVFGKNYALEKPRGYKTKSRMAQEAHEAIRPTNLKNSINDIVEEKKLTSSHKRLYQLIFNRAIVTQMRESEFRLVKISVLSGKSYLFESELQQVIFDGFLRVLNPEFVKRSNIGTSLKKEDRVTLDKVEIVESKTNPPPRYNEATLIKSMEEKGIGRPSTYAPIVSLIQDKNYVEKVDRYFAPTNLGTGISDYLSNAFPDIFSIEFTARMEEGLDEVANGKEDLIKLLETFYSPFKSKLEQKKQEKEVIDIEEDFKEICPEDGGKLMIRFSRFGKFIGCSNYPKCKFTKPFLTFIEGKFCPEDSGRVVVRYSKKRKRFYGCENYPKCNWSAWKLSWSKQK